MEIPFVHFGDLCVALGYAGYDISIAGEAAHDGDLESMRSMHESRYCAILPMGVTTLTRG